MRRAMFLCLLLAVPGCAMVRPSSTPPGYIVFFTERSAALDETAAQVVFQAAKAAKAAPSAVVTVAGYTDSNGPAQADVLLSERRAGRVAEALIADGVPAARIVRQGRGQTHADPGVESRRVEILVGS